MTRLLPFKALFPLFLLLASCTGQKEPSYPHSIAGKSLLVEKEGRSKNKALYVYTFKKSTYSLVEGSKSLESGKYTYLYQPHNEKARILFQPVGGSSYEADLSFFSAASGSWDILNASEVKAHAHDEGSFSFVMEDEV